MKLAAVTFDCAQTLIAVDWRPAVLAVECAQALGLSFDEVDAASCYDRLLRSRWHEFRELNLLRDEGLADAFWKRMTDDWADACGFEAEAASALLRTAEERLYGRDSTVFRLYDDVIPTLDRLVASGISLAVVSNWDVSLHKTLRAFGLAPYFATAVASMEEGVEKPDPRIFQIALERLAVPGSSVLHVGDNPIDDFQGAKRAGLHALVIDRENEPTSSVYIASLCELPERLGL